MPNIYQRKLLEVGHSVAVTIPKPWLNYYGLKIGDEVELITDDVIVVRPIEKKVVRKKVK